MNGIGSGSPERTRRRAEGPRAGVATPGAWRRRRTNADARRNRIGTAPARHPDRYDAH
jgi:hypothetical protein